MGKQWGKKKGKGMARAAPPGRAHTGSHWLLCLEALSPPHRWDSQQNFNHFSRCASPGSWSSLLGQCQGRES